MVILTHRGLDPGVSNFFAESSFEAFQNHLNRGFEVEFDVNFTKGNRIIVFHDPGLERVSSGAGKRLFKDLEARDVRNIRLGGGERLCFLEELLKLIDDSGAEINALHLKGIFQEKYYLDVLIEYLQNYPEVLGKILISDVKPKAAEYLLSKIPNLILAPSVAHEYDIKRYNECVKGTLISVGEAIECKNLYKWVWLDEWDLLDEGDEEKKFYTEENFSILKNYGFKIALVTPELHGTSPGLLGGEAHQDASDLESLFKRIEEIVKLRPDAVCTDYPDKVNQLISQL